MLDIGAGTGRNTLPIARLGHPTSAVELSPDLAKILRDEAAKEKLPVTLVEGEYKPGGEPQPLKAEGTDPVYVGRVRDDLAVPGAINLWVVSDNLLKGAALNAVQIAEILR